MMSQRMIAVLGATGQQGGSVIHEFLSKPEWKVRGITRNTGSDAAKGLIAQGVEMVSANLDDEESLVKAFEGADVIFGVTNWWEIFATNGMDPNTAGDQEYTQALNLANAARRTSTLTHYVFSTLEAPSNSKLSVPHFDYKTKANAYIKENMKDLLPRTTFLLIGYYSTNIGTIPMLKFIPTSPLSPDIQLLSVPPSTMAPCAGDVGVNTGITTAAIIDQPHLTLPGKYAVLQTDELSFEDQAQQWSQVSGRAAICVQVDVEDYVKIWGPFGVELDLNMQLFRSLPVGLVNTVDPGTVTVENLGITDKLHNTRKAFETLHAKSVEG